MRFREGSCVERVVGLELWFFIEGYSSGLFFLFIFVFLSRLVFFNFIGRCYGSLFRLVFCI